ncbi:cation diffusion facilitator family transporter [Guyparkeria hydrothermalis]|uniref:cation diffusion facilitator family transporter n=1 Tax=Guyparkeria hydrothermalis TaxID=923 RepID=UPI002020B74B|nr:cation diffusion facilitator family transporter [Guyparkeria hydrothermalis]MCL7744556.1 cation diffusion facilitator family transporter [Guyparkeria hydrothermalis]
MHEHHAPDELIDHAGRALGIGIALNLGFVMIEAVAGILGQSMALLADAAHNLGDVLGLVLAWGANRLSRRLADRQFSYGLGSSTVLAALINGITLILASLWILWEAGMRLLDPPTVDGMLVIAVALAGVLVNAGTAWLLMAQQKHDLNLRGAFLHMAADAAVSVAVALSGLLILLTGLTWIDPALSILVSLVILIPALELSRRALQLILHGVPAGVDLDEVDRYLSDLPGVSDHHHLHVWALSTRETALSVHLVMPEPPMDGDRFLRDLQEALDERFDIRHATVQIERGTFPCPIDG